VADTPNLDQTQPLPPQAPAFFSRYRMKAELGRGGMGIVWRAEDTKLQRDVALKFLPDYVVRDREAMADLAAETRRCLDLTHPNIVRVYDLVEEGDRAAISMELVDGGSLAGRKLEQLDRCFSVSTISPWIAQLCSALDYAHTKVRIVHRDLKPLNLLVNTEGDLKVVDFGIARSLLNSGTRLSVSAKAVSVSIGYAGPQQVMGEPAAVTDDIYSLGATVYELLTGKPPFYEGDIITQLREVVPPSMTARRAALGVTTREPIPAAWEETIAACLAKKTADRPQSAAEVAHRLGFPLSSPTRFLESTTTSRPDVKVGPEKSFQKKSVIAAGLAAAALVVAAILWPRSATAVKPTASAANLSSAAPTPVVPAAPQPEFVVTVSPPDVGAHVWLANVSDRLVPDNGALALTGIPDGEHQLTVNAPGYKNYVHPIRLKISDGKGTIEVKLIPIFGSVQITARAGTLVTATDARNRERSVGTVPAGGKLRVDNVLTVGTYVFEFDHPDCSPVQQANVAIAAARVTNLSPVQVGYPGELRVFSVPDGASVLVNGTKVGVTPATLPGQPSEKPLAVEVFAPGYHREPRTITLKPRETQSLDVGSLTLESGAIHFTDGTAEWRLPRALVRVDGHDVTIKGGKLDGVEVGKREVEIQHPDFETWKQTVTVLDRKPVTVAVKLVAKPAELTFAVTGPPTFTVTANGKAVAVKNNRATVPAGEELSLAISAIGYKPDFRKLTLPAKGKEKITLIMTKVAVAEVGQPWTIPELGLTLLPVPVGKFTMGSATGELNERPVTQVTITKPFWLGKTEVTQRNWTALMETNPSTSPGEQLPVSNVSWAEAIAFCKKLTDRERTAGRLPPGYVYTLPTEAQWEHASRAGDMGAAPADIAESSWHAKNSGETLHPVASLKANAWGFYDMHGNVWEWCADLYSTKLHGGSVNDPIGTKGSVHVRRGGSCAVSPAFLRFSARGMGDPMVETAHNSNSGHMISIHTLNIGFRVALAASN